MSNFTRKALFWAPRGLCILTALFLMLFSLDVFEEGKSAGDIALGLLMHNLPSLFIFIVLYFAWRWEWVGTVVYVGLALFYIIWAWGKFHITAYFAISGPLFLVGILFLLGWIYRREVHPPNAIKPV